MANIRKSHIEDYLFCQQKIPNVWIRDGQFTDENLPGTPPLPAAYGTRFHEFAYRFWDYCGTIDPELWEGMIPKEFYPKDPLADPYENVEFRMAAWFVDFQRERLKTCDPDVWRPILRETKMVHKGLRLQGTTDFIAWWDKDQNEIAIGEYKTSNVKPETAHFYLEALLRQLAFYTIMWQESINMGTVTNIVCINPRMQRVDKLTLRPGHIDAMLDYIIELKLKLASNGPWNRKCSDRKYAVCQLCTPSEVEKILFK